MKSIAKFNVNSKNLPTLFIAGLLLMGLYYLSYRYPFQINSSTTSPTYKDTPVILQGLKYVLFGGWVYLFAILLTKLRPRNFYKKELLLLTITLILTVPPIISFVFTKNAFLFQTGIFFIALLCYLFIEKKEIDTNKISKYLSVFIIIAVLAESVQLLLFYSTGRLPALAYKDSISVRFGSIWDDPNGFAMFISFLLPFALVKSGKLFPRIVWTVIFLFMLIITQSLTGIASTLTSLFIGIGLLYFVTSSRKTLKKFILLSIFYLIGVWIFVKVILPSPTIQLFLYLKSGSIEGHLNIFDYFNHVGILEYFGLNPFGMYGESGYVNIMLNFGLLYLVAFLILGIMTVFLLLNKIKKHKYQKGVEVYYGALFYVISYYVAMSNLPIDTVFPLNLFLVICIMISISNPKDEEKIKQKNRKVFKRKRIVW